MAKGARSKIKKRFRSLKRKYINEIIGKADAEELNKRVQMKMQG